MKVEVVTHCWRYSRLLCYQLSSFFLYPPDDVEVTVTVFYSAEDLESVAVINYFRGLPQPPSVHLRPRELLRSNLLRRSIGRNLAALQTAADWIWFTDCDYVFGATCLDGLPAALTNVTSPLAFPRYINLNATHAEGDRLISQVNRPGTYDIMPGAFVKRRMPRAIGGVQLVTGDAARTRGYLPNSFWQTPVEGYKFCRCREDCTYRKSFRTPASKIELPAVYRIRHSVCGRQSEDVRL